MYHESELAETLYSYPIMPFEYSWIALVLRGECEFLEKIRTIQALGALAVVVYKSLSNQVDW